LSDAAASGLTLFEYARRHGLSDATLYGWRLRLERGAAGSKRVRRGGRRRSSPLPTPTPTPLAEGSAGALAFVPVVVVDGRDSPTGGGSGVELAVGRVTVRVARGFCAATLGRVLPLVLDAEGGAAAEAVHGAARQGAPC